MRAALAVADVRFRGASAAGLAALVPVGFLAGFAAAKWAPELPPAARAAAAGGTALAVCAAGALLAALVAGATAFAKDVRTGAAQGLLAAPVSRLTVLAAGVFAHGLFATLLLTASSLAALIGLDLGGAGTRDRAAPRAFHEALVSIPSGRTAALVDRENPVATAEAPMPRGIAQGDPTPIRFSPRAHVETSLDTTSEAEVAWTPAGETPSSWVRIPFKARVEFEATVPAPPCAAGERTTVHVRRTSGGWALRFGPGSVQIGGAPRRFAPEVLLAVLCAAPLLFLAAAAGALASARMGSAASLIVVAAFLVAFAGRDVVADAAAYVVERWDAQQCEATGGHQGHDHDHDHDHAGHAHGHGTEVTALQHVLARGAQAGLRAVPDPADFLRFSDVSEGRALRAEDLGRAALRGFVPLAAVVAAAWLLLRRREILPG